MSASRSPCNWGKRTDRVSYPAGGARGDKGHPLSGPVEAKPACAPVSLTRSTLQEMRCKLKELEEPQEMTKATLERLVAKTADELQEQVRSRGSAPTATAWWGGPGGVPSHIPSHVVWPWGVLAPPKGMLGRVTNTPCALGLSGRTGLGEGGFPDGLVPQHPDLLPASTSSRSLLLLPFLQLGEPRAMVASTGQEQAEAQAACPVCSTDISKQAGQLLQRYEKLQEVVDDFTSRQAVGNVVRQLPGRSQVGRCQHGGLGRGLPAPPQPCGMALGGPGTTQGGAGQGDKHPLCLGGSVAELAWGREDFQTGCGSFPTCLCLPLGPFSWCDQPHGGDGASGAT